MYLFLDTETTGLAPDSRIVSIAWAIHDPTGAPVATRHHVIYPDGFTIPATVTKIHGITTAFARLHGIPVAAALHGLYADIAAFHPAVFIGHNVSFDRPIVLNEYRRLAAPENLSRLRTFCTMERTTHVCRLPRRDGSPGYKWPRLTELHAHLFGHEPAAAHDAAADVQACAACFFELRRRNIITLPPFNLSPFNLFNHPSGELIAVN